MWKEAKMSLVLPLTMLFLPLHLQLDVAADVIVADELEQQSFPTKP